MDDRYVNTAATSQDLHSPETKVPTVIGVSVFMMVLATTTMASRLYTRIRILRVTGPDDWLVLVGWALTVGHGITQCVMTRANLGRHVGFVTKPQDFTTFLKMFYASLIMYNGALMAIKLAFLAQYYRIMTREGALKRALIIISCIIGLWTTSQMVIVIFQCQPVSGFWAPTPNTVCVPSLPGLYISAAGNIASDLVIVALPLPLIRGLHLPLAQKLVLSFVFCLGLVLLRLKYLKVSPDVTWDIADSNLCSLAEISSGIACACVPTLKPLAAQLFPKLFSTLRTQFADLRAPTPEWKPRNLKEMLRDDGAASGGLGPGPAARVPLAGEPQQADHTAAARRAAVGRPEVRRLLQEAGAWASSSAARVPAAPGRREVGERQQQAGQHADDADAGDGRDAGQRRAASREHGGDRGDGQGVDSGVPRPGEPAHQPVELFDLREAGGDRRGGG
ncbi:uncharacterized protein PG998_006347 [Apiospora kogelbergensis]|uniref:uncharacterized protein n=1 Tax=Apiospora kogelbergensis TaxID=1337665 RepID=UPI0031301A72